MKNYLWIAAIVSVSTLNIYAEENPFALQENFQKIDKNADDLLNSLKKIYSERKEKKQVVKFVEPSIEQPLASEDNAVDSSIIENNITDINVSKEEEQHNEDSELAFKKAIEEQENLAKEAEAAEEVRLEKVKQEQTKVEEEKVRLEQVKIEEEKAKTEQVKKEEERKKVLEAKKELENKENVKKEQELKDTSKNIVDINTTEEELKALTEADEALLKAMQEVDED